ncbi:MAG: serine hydrolase domain-containing protein [Enhygromyxa sp.]
MPDEPEDEELDEPTPAQPRRCEAPPKQGVATPDFSHVERFAEAVLERRGLSSVAVAVARDGEILWERGFGWVDRRRQVRADEHTMYSLASVSKPFTATAIMVLREQGKLRLEQPIDELLPPPGLRAGAGDPADATIRRVASHTAGLPLHHQFYYEGEASPPPAAVTRERYAVLVSAPGEQYRYSNLGFGLLGEVVARQGGGDFASVMRTLVLDPLELRHTFVGHPPRAAGVTAIRHDEGGRALPDYGFDHDGASAFYSSAHDLVRFGMFHLGHAPPEHQALLSPEARALMHEPVPPADDYGLGWGLGRDDAVARVSHGGGMPGVAAAIRMFPEQGVVVVVLFDSNAVDGAHVKIANMIEDAVGLPARADDLCALSAESPWLGTWEGQVETIAGPRPLTLQLRPTGEITAQLGDTAPASVRQAKLVDGILRGWFIGDAAAERSDETRGFLALELRLRDETRLDGGLTARVPGDVSATTAFVALQRAGAQRPRQGRPRAASAD